MSRAIWLCVVMAAVACTARCAAGPFAPSCDRKTGTVLEAQGLARAAATAEYFVISPRHSNLIMVLSWPNTAARLGLRATLTGCGEHPGCQFGVVSTAPSSGPGVGPGSLRLRVDGWRGKQYQVEVSGDASGQELEERFTLTVTFDTGICT